MPAGQRCPTCDKPWVRSTRPATTSRRQRRRRAQLLARQPVCACPGCTDLATEDDHIVPWSQRGAMTFAEWDAPANHQGLCKPHHDDKTAAEALAARRRR